MRISRSPAISLGAVLVAAAAWKALFLIWDVIPFNADEAVVALMARHILQGERPVFFYGQAYMGSLDAYLVAAGFLVFGQQIWVIRLVQGILYLGTLATTFLLARRAFDSDRAGLLAAAVLAIPTVNAALYTTASLGGYGEALLLGNLILLVSVHLGRCALPERRRETLPFFALWGLLAGLGLWVNGLTLVYSLPSALYLLFSIPRQAGDRAFAGMILCAAAGGILGAAPWWFYAAGSGWSRLVEELLGKAVSVETGSWIFQLGTHLVTFVLLGLTALFGFRPPWSVTWLALPLLPFMLAFWMGVLVFGFRSLRSENWAYRREAWLLAGIPLVTAAGFLFTSFGADPSGRYFLPMMIPLAVAAAFLILKLSKKLWQVAALLGLVIVFQGWGTVQSAFAFPQGLTTQFYEPSIIDHRADADLIQFLREQGETRGYTNYWVAYPLAFRSAEDLVFIPRLPYHLDLRYTPRDDRSAPYTALVEQSSRAAFITTRSPALDEHLVAEFNRLGVEWQEAKIGDYHVFYHLSRVVPPVELGLGEERP